MKAIQCAVLAGLCVWGLESRAQDNTFVTNGLVAYYSFNGNANDTSGYGNNGAANAVTFVPDRFGIASNAVFLNGSSAYVGIPYSTNFNIPGNGQFTLAAWFKLSGYGSGALGIGSLIVKGTANGAWDYGLECPYANQLVLWAGQGGQYPCVSTNVLQLSKWYQGVVTYSNAHWALYQNGVLLNETNTAYQITTSAGGLAIGRKGEAATDNFYGTIDDVRIYNRALSASEVSRLYAGNFVVSGIATIPAITLSGFPGGTYSLQYVNDIAATNWITFQSNIVVQSTFAVLPDTNALNQPKRFYRVVAQ